MDVPIIIRHNADDIDVAELTLVENIQREDLNAIEESCAYQTLINRFKLSQEEISARVGKDRSTVANSLRLANLPEEAKEALIKKLSPLDTQGPSCRLILMRNRSPC